MANVVKADRSRIYYGDFDQVWPLLQYFYKKGADDPIVRLGGRRAFYRTTTLSVLAQIEAIPECRQAMFASLLAYTHQAKSLDSMETLFLTLLVANNSIRDRSAFNRGMQIWETFGAKPTVAGAGPMGFYNIINRRMTFFSREATQTLRRYNGRTLVFGSDIGHLLESLGKVSLDNLFDVGLPSQTIQPLQIRRRADGRPTTSDVWKSGAKAVSASLGRAGTILRVVPFPPVQTVGFVCQVVAGTITVVILWDDFITQIHALPSFDAPNTPPGPIDVGYGVPYEDGGTGGTSTIGVYYGNGSGEEGGGVGGGGGLGLSLIHS